jgi:hypothetical protein
MGVREIRKKVGETEREREREALSRGCWETKITPARKILLNFFKERI